ncbi:MAG: YfhO family protein, partial [Ignavibacteriaceae bacterium]
VRILSLRKEPDLKVQRLIRNAAIVFGGLFVISLLLASPIKDWFVGRIIESGEKGTRLQPLHDYMSNMFLTDARLAFLFTAAVFGMAYAFIKGKLSGDLFAIAVAVLILIDLFRVNHRGETYTDNAQQENLFIKPDYIQAIENTGDRSLFRVLNLKQDGSIGSLNQNSNFLTYFLQYDIYGYSGIKPRAIQDYYDVLGSPANSTFWRMLNVKYIVFDQAINQPGLLPIYNGTNSFLYQNQNALPRAYFVNRVEKKPSLEILNMVKNNQFDPLDMVFTEKKITGIDQPDSTAFVNITSFEDERIEIDVIASGSNFLFLGDTYFPKGWSASIDGTETEIYRANHGFRGIVVPKGEHKIVFRYLPESFVISKYVALLLSTLTILGLILGLFFRKKQKNLATTG